MLRGDASLSRFLALSFVGILLEYDKNTDTMMLDRVLHSSCHYPGDYGKIYLGCYVVDEIMAIKASSVQCPSASDSGRHVVWF